MRRKLNPYETNLLIKYGLDPVKVSESIDSHIPIEYVIRVGNFYENEFYLTQNTLIPRIETEFLIELGLKYVIDSQKSIVTFADVGTGSGAIGITFALELFKRNMNFKGILSDNSDGALKVAKKNLEEYNKILNTKMNIRIIKAHLMKLYPVDKFDIVFANLPYIPSARIPKLPLSVRNYEPMSALEGGEDGLIFIRELLSHAQKCLSKDGLLMLEVDDTHTPKVAKEFKDDWEVDIKNDYDGKNRFWICKVK